MYTSITPWDNSTTSGYRYIDPTIEVITIPTVLADGSWSKRSWEVSYTGDATTGTSLSVTLSSGSDSAVLDFTTGNITWTGTEPTEFSTGNFAISLLNSAGTINGFYNYKPVISLFNNNGPTFAPVIYRFLAAARVQGFIICV